MFKRKYYNKTPLDWLINLNQDLPNKRIVYPSGATKQYLRSTLAESIHAACMHATGYLGEAEQTARQVCKEVEAWLENKYEVTNSDIQRIARKALRKYNPQAAFAYAPSDEIRIKRDTYGFIRL